MKITKLLIAVFSVMALLTVKSYGEDSAFPKVGTLYYVVFEENEVVPGTAIPETTAPIREGNWVLKVDQVSSTNPNWIEVEFPSDANSVHSEQLKYLQGRRWINLNFVRAMKEYTPSTAK